LESVFMSCRNLLGSAGIRGEMIAGLAYAVPDSGEN
jgi:hypothetical protein